MGYLRQSLRVSLEKAVRLMMVGAHVTVRLQLGAWLTAAAASMAEVIRKKE
jgi:hypothetical protein